MSCCHCKPCCKPCCHRKRRVRRRRGNNNLLVLGLLGLLAARNFTNTAPSENVNVVNLNNGQEDDIYDDDCDRDCDCDCCCDYHY